MAQDLSRFLAWLLQPACTVDSLVTSVLLNADGSAVELDFSGHPVPGTKIPEYYKYTGTRCNFSNIGGTAQPEPMPWLWLWFGGSTVSASRSWKRIATDVQLPVAPQGAPGVEFRIDMWLGPQPAPVPEQMLEKCQKAVPCNFCEYWEHRHMYYDAGAFMKLMTGTSGLAAPLFPGDAKNMEFGNASKGEWLVSPIIEMGIPSVCPDCVKTGGGFKASTGDVIHMNFEPSGNTTWRISAHNQIGTGHTSFEFDNNVLFERFLAGAINRSEIKATDPQVELARMNTWKWVLLPYTMMRVMTKPSLEDVPNFFVNFTQWSNTVIEQQGGCSEPSDPSCYKSFFRFEDGLAIVGHLVGTHEVISYSTFDSWVRDSTGAERTSETYKYRNCINAIIQNTLNNSIKTSNPDRSQDFRIVAFPDGNPAECQSAFYVATGGVCTADAQCMSPRGKCRCFDYDVIYLLRRLLSDRTPRCYVRRCA